MASKEKLSIYAEKDTDTKEMQAPGLLSLIPEMSQTICKIKYGRGEFALSPVPF